MSDERYAKIWAQLDWETPIGTVTFLPSYNDRHTENNQARLQDSQVPDVYSMDYTFSKAHQDSFEARLASSGDSAFDYVFGIFYIDAESSNWGVLTGQVIDDPRRTGQTSKAVFGQGAVDLTDRLHGTLGLRYTRDTKDYYTEETEFGTGGKGRGEKEWTRTDWKVGVEMDIFEDSLVYADVATGYRPGTANNRASATALDEAGNVITYPNQFSETEELLAYEMGAKTQFFNKRLTVNLDAYFYDYTNRQYTELLPEVPLDQLCPNGTKPADDLTDNPATGLCYAERNMGKVETYGAEFSSVMRPTEMIPLIYR